MEIRRTLYTHTRIKRCLAFLFSAFLFISPAFSTTLPSGYTELEYLTSTQSKQYIEDPTFQTINTGAIEIKTTNLEKRCRFAGWGGNTETSVAIALATPTPIDNDFPFKYGCWNDKTDNTVNIADENTLRYEFEPGSQKLYVNGVLNKQATINSTDCLSNIVPYNFRLFDISRLSGSSTIYYCKVYDGSGNLLREYIPARRNSDGVLGMYDTVTNTFFTNAGTGTFTAGPVVVAPCGSYTELEYIESTGTQVIDTGFVYNNNTRVIWDMQMTTQLPLSANNNSGVGYVNTEYERLGLSFSNSTLNLYKAYSTGNTVLPTINTDNNRHVIEINSPVNKAYVDGIEYAFNSAVGNINNNNNLTLPLFAWLGNTGYREYFTGRMYSVKIYDNGTLVRNMIPARNSDGVVGLCDTVNDKFYTNAGAGTFTAGPKPEIIPCGYTKLDYIGFTGQQSLRTGIVPGNSLLSMDIDMQFVSYTESGFGEIFFGSGSHSHAGDGIGFGIYNNQWSDIKPGTSWNTFGGTITNNRIQTTWTIDGTTSTSVFTGGLTHTTTDSAYYGNDLPWRDKYITIVPYPGSSKVANWNLYGLKIKLDNGLVFNGVPAKYGDVLGLYDTVSGQFFTNKGSGTFVAGPTIASNNSNCQVVNINWGGLSGDDALGSCTYGGTFTAPSTVPTAAAGYKFLGWLPR